MELDRERVATEVLRTELTQQLHHLICPDIPYERLVYLRKKAREVPEILNSPEIHYAERPEELERSLKNTLAMQEFANRENLTHSEAIAMMAQYNEVTNWQYHFGFFLEIFAVQASEEQKARYMPQINSLEIVACFAQTELGHGSNVRGIETTAHYNVESDHFILNSPSITSIKWWVGALGVGSNFALLVARLIIQENDYGPHALFVQIRDRKTHEPLPGVSVGDIGPKMGLVGNDNGFLKFESFKVL